MKAAVMENLDQTIDLSITHEEKIEIIKPFWSKGGTNE